MTAKILHSIVTYQRKSNTIEHYFGSVRIVVGNVTLRKDWKLDFYETEDNMCHIRKY